MKLKEAKTFDEQINILRRRGLIIKDVNEAKIFLSNINYYRFTAYLIDYKLNGSIENDNFILNGRNIHINKLKITNKNRYKNGIEFDYIKNIYMFDRELKHLLLSALETIEISFRTYIAYTIATKYGPLGYKNHNNFLNKKNYDKFKKAYSKSLELNKYRNYIEHHNKKYNKNIPIWVLVEILSFGTLSRLYSTLKTSDKKFIQRELCPVNFNLVSQWIYMLSKLRNECAHYERLYKTQLPDIILHNRYKSKNYDRNSLFSYLLAIKELTYYKESWNRFISELNSIIVRYSFFIELDKLGFPEDWFEILSK